MSLEGLATSWLISGGERCEGSLCSTAESQNDTSGEVGSWAKDGLKCAEEEKVPVTSRGLSGVPWKQYAEVIANVVS